MHAFDSKLFDLNLQDGGYNKPIPAQYYETMNHPVSAEPKTDEQFNSNSDVLCTVCSRNQLLKVKQLANFVPYNEVRINSSKEYVLIHLILM